jgi:glycerophosphoryl diester phosphodiesterase
LVVAHRGASARVPENTIAAFQAAVEEGADVVELDVRLTEDGIPVVLHDPDVTSTTDGTGYVHQLTLAEVKRLDASPGERERHEVPTLAEALEAIGGAGVNLEIKNLPGEPAFDSPREATLEAAVGILGEVRFEGPVLVSSFNWLTIERARELAPGVRVGTWVVDDADTLALLYSWGIDAVATNDPGLAVSVRDAAQ